MTKYWVLVAAAAVCVATPGCGDDEADTPERSAPAVTEEETCGAMQDAVASGFGSLFPTGSETPPAAEAAPVLVDITEEVSLAADRFEALRVGPDDARLAPVSDALGDAIEALSGARDMALDGDDAYLDAMAEVNATGAALQEALSEASVPCPEES